MSGDFTSTQARNTLIEGKKCEGKFLSDLGHKMATSGSFEISLQLLLFKVTLKVLIWFLFF